MVIDMIRKKLAASLLCLGMVGVMLTGCGDSEDAGKETTAATEGKLKNLSDYKGLEVYKSKVQVTDEAIDEQMKQAAEDNAEEKEKKGKIVKGDTANIDYVGKVDGETFTGGSDTGYDLKIGSGTFIDGFEDQLIGHKAGDKFAITVTFPETYKNNPDLAGKEANFDITVNKVTETVVPEVNDEFVKKYFGYTDCKNVKEFKAYIKDRLRLNQIINAVWSSYLETCEVESYDSEDVENMKERISSYMEYQIYYTTGSDVSTYLQQAGMTQETWDAQILEQAQASSKEKMVVMAIAEKEGWTVSDEEYKEQAAIYATQQSVNSIEELESVYGKTEIEYSILSNKVFKVISDNAKVVEDPETTTTAETTTPAESTTPEETTAE